MRKHLILLLTICLPLFVLTSCGGDSATKKKDKTAVNAKKSAKKKSTAKGKKAPAAKKSKTDFKGRKLDPRSARASVMRVQGTPLKKSSALTTSAKDGNVKIMGWAFDDKMNKPADKVFLEINGSYFPASYGFDNANVAKRLKIPALTKTGFRASIPTNKVKGGVWKVNVVVMSPNGKTYFKTEKPLAVITVK